MIILRQFAMLCAMLALFTCAMHSPDVSATATNPALATIHAKGKTGWLGSNAAVASPEEGPMGKAKFDYDFWMGKTEVTNREFLTGMGRSLANSTTLDLPVTQVNYWDVALYCNRLSKAQGYDTVYSYLGIDSASSGLILGLQGIQVHWNRNGYRLPTEAEWEYVAHNGDSSDFMWGNDSAQAKKYAWYLENSGGTLHPVAQLQANAFGVYDLAGNAIEWVDGWLGPHDSATTLDPIGAAEPDQNEERIIKGGSFLNAITGLRISLRTDAYPANYGLRNDALGFRVARGAIPNPSYQGTASTASAKSNATLQVSRSDLNAFLGAVQVKFATVDANTEALLWVDFASSDLLIHQLTDVVPIRHPQISPDGQWVAYCTRMEGQTGASQVIVRRLDETGSGRYVLPAPSAAIPRWWVDPASQDTFIVFVNSAASDEDSASWSTERTFSIQISNGAALGLPQEISQNAGAFHDGYGAQGRYLATGYTSLRVRDLQSSQTQTLFQFPANGKSAAGSTQVCNVSMAPDSSSKLLFLDFGYGQNSTLVGRPYAIHEILFFANPDGTVTDFMPTPAGFAGWEHTEWSNRPGYAVAALWDAQEDPTTVVAVDVNKKLTKTIMTGSNFLHPTLWQSKASVSAYNLDSLGNYFSVTQNYWVNNLTYKMRLFWESCDTIQGYIMGSSRQSWGINPSKITAFSSMNLGMAGESLRDALKTLRRYVLPNSPNLKYLILGADVDLINEAMFNWYTDNMEASEGYLYDSHHQFWANQRDSNFMTSMKQQTIPEPYSPFSEPVLGHEFPTTGAGWAGNNPELSVPPYWVDDSAIVERVLDTLDQTLTVLEQRGITTFLIQMPVSPHYVSATGCWATYGPCSVTRALQVQDEIHQVVQKHSHVFDFDFNQNGKHAFPDSEAFNSYHLNSVGADHLSTMLNDSIGIALRLTQ